MAQGALRRKYALCALIQAPPARGVMHKAWSTKRKVQGANGKTDTRGAKREVRSAVLRNVMLEVEVQITKINTSASSNWNSSGNDER